MKHTNKKQRAKRTPRQIDEQEPKGRVIKEKFKKERILPPIQPKNPKQDLHQSLLQQKQVIIATGPAGTGKTFLTSAHAADQFRAGDIEKIIVARPYVVTGKTSGYKPGTSLDKLYPFVRNMLDTIKERIGNGAYENALKDGLSGQIEVQELESIRGRSFDQPSILIIDECFHPDHQVLTRVGWKRIANIEEDCEVLQYNLDGSSEFVKIERKIEKDFKGSLELLNNSKVSYCVTPKHDLVLTDDKQKVYKSKAQEKSKASQYHIAGSMYSNATDYPITDAEIKLAVAVQADGSLQERGGNKSYQISISKERKILRLLGLMKETELFHEIKASRGRSRFYEGDYTTSILSDCKDKNFKLEEILQFSYRQLNVFLEEVKCWDGFSFKTGFGYSTTNKHNAEVVQTVAHLCGKRARISKIEDKRKDTYKTCYKVAISSNIYFKPYGKDRSTVQYEGKVYCVTVPSGMVLTKYRDSIHVSGNCQQSTKEEIISILTRISEDCQLVLCGDLDQKDIRGESGLAWFSAFAERHDLDVGVIEYTSNDIVRSGFVKSVIKGIETDRNTGK